MDENDKPAAVEADEQGDQDLDSELPEETTDWKAEASKFKRLASRYRSRYFKATEAKVTDAKVESKPESKPQETAQPENSALLEKLERVSIKQAGITHPDDVELARTTAKKWGVDIDEVLEDEDFKAKLSRQQTHRNNVEATSGIRGTAASSDAKNDPAYWLAKGTPPTADQVADRKTRAKIARAFMANSGSGKKFYND